MAPSAGETAEQQLIRILGTDKVSQGPTVHSYKKAAQNMRKSFENQHTNSTFQNKQTSKTVHPQIFSNNSFNLSHNSGSQENSMNIVQAQTSDNYLKQSGDKSITTSLTQQVQANKNKQGAPGISSSFKVSGGHKLLSKQSKIISSANAVKKPTSNITVKNQGGHQKTKSSFIGQRVTTTCAGNTNLLTKQSQQQPPNSHQRIKSDVNAQYNISAPNNQAIQAFQIHQREQRGKVGKILKNNFLVGDSPAEMQSQQDMSMASANFGPPNLLDGSVNGQMQGLTADHIVPNCSSGLGLQITTLDSNKQGQNLPNQTYQAVNKNNSLFSVPPSELNSFISGNGGMIPPSTQEQQVHDNRYKVREVQQSNKKATVSGAIKTEVSQKRMTKSDPNSQPAKYYQGSNQNTNKKAAADENSSKSTKEKYMELQMMYNDLLEKHKAITGKESDNKQSSTNQTSLSADPQNSGTNHTNMRIKRYYQNNRQSFKNQKNSSDVKQLVEVGASGVSLTADEITDVSPVQQEHSGPLVNQNLRQAPQQYRQTKTMLTNQQQQQAQDAQPQHRATKSMQFANSKIINSRELKQPVHTRTASCGNNSVLNSGRKQTTTTQGGTESTAEQHIMVTKNADGVLKVNYGKDQEAAAMQAEYQLDTTHGAVVSYRPQAGHGTPDRTQEGLVTATQGGTHRRSVSDGADSASLLKFKSKFLHQSGNAPNSSTNQQPSQQPKHQQAVTQSSNFKEQQSRKGTGRANTGSSHKTLQQAPHPTQPSHPGAVGDENITDTSARRPKVTNQKQYLQHPPAHSRFKSDDIQKHQVLKNNSAYFQEMPQQQQKKIDQPQIILKSKVKTTPQSNKNRHEASRLPSGMTGNNSSSKLLQAAQFTSQQQKVQAPKEFKLGRQQVPKQHNSIEQQAEDEIEETSPQQMHQRTKVQQYRNTQENQSSRPASGIPSTIVPKKTKASDLMNNQVQSGRQLQNSQNSAANSIQVGHKQLKTRIQQSSQQVTQAADQSMKKQRQPSTSSTRRTVSQQQQISAGAAQQLPSRQINNLFVESSDKNAPTIGAQKIQEVRLTASERRQEKSSDSTALQQQKQLLKVNVAKNPLLQEQIVSEKTTNGTIKKLTSGALSGQTPNSVQHKRVKSDANDQNRMQRMKEVMFVMGSTSGPNQMVDRSVKTLPKKSLKGNSLSQRISPNMAAENGEEKKVARKKQMRAQQLQNFIIEGGLERQDEDEGKHVNVSFDNLDDPDSGDDQQSPVNMNQEENDRSQINNFQEQVLSNLKNNLNHKQQQQQSQLPPNTAPGKQAVHKAAVGLNISGNHSISGSMHEAKQQKYKKMMQQQRANNQHSKSELPPQKTPQNGQLLIAESDGVSDNVEDDEQYSQRQNHLNQKQNKAQKYFQGGVQHSSKNHSSGMSPNMQQQPPPSQQRLRDQPQPQITFNMQISPKFIFNNGQSQQVQAKSHVLTSTASQDLIQQQQVMQHKITYPNNREQNQQQQFVPQSVSKKQQSTKPQKVERGATPPFGPGGLVPPVKEPKKESGKQQQANYLINLQENSSMQNSEEDESHEEGNHANSEAEGERPQTKPMFVPMNSLNFPSARSPDVPGKPEPSTQTKEQQKAKDEKTLSVIKHERIETQDSLQQDPTISPRTKALRKLIHHIHTQVGETSRVPQTTVEFYRVGCVLGKGAFGKVNLALHLPTQKMVAIKSINKKDFSEDSQIRKVKQEVMILKRTHHRNIVKLYEYFETQKHILFVIELAAGGDLLNYVRKRRNLKEDVAKSVFKQIIDALSYCHSKQILHRDIKLDNILLTINGEIKICDFGVGKIVRAGETMTEQCGTPAYIAPEILLDKGYTGFAVDIWSAGVVLYAMLYGSVPFKANDLAELQRHIISANYQHQNCISREAKDLLDRILEKDPRQRISIAQIRKHSWMKDAKDTVELFTSAEKKYLKAEFVDRDCMADRFNRNQETDPFLDENDVKNASMLKNAETKSVILAPFNSTKTNMNLQSEQDDSIDSFVKELILPRNVIKFGKAVREINNQYEVNNNQELDNGVYHDYWVKDQPEEGKDNNSQADSLQSSFEKNTSLNGSKDGKKKKKKEKNAGNELARLENMMKKQEVEQPYTGNEEQNKMVAANSANAAEDHLQQAIQAPEIGREIKIDDEILKQVLELGFTESLVRKHLDAKDLNCATTSYFLLESVVEVDTPMPDSAEQKQNN